MDTKQNSDSIPKICHFYWDNPSTFTFLNLLTILSFNRYNGENNWQLILWEPKFYYEEITWQEHCNKDKIHDKKLRAYNYIKNNIKNVTIKQINFDEIGFSNIISEVHKSYYLRYYILNKYGGIWSELDIIYTKPITLNFDYDNILFKCMSVNNKEKKNAQYEDHILWYTYYPVGFFCSKINSKLFEFILNNCVKNYDKTKYQSIGSDLLMNLLNKYTTDELTNLFEENNCILSNEYYLPYQWYDVDILFLPQNINHATHITENTFAIHWFNGHPLSKRYININKHCFKHKQFKINCLVDTYVNEYIDIIYDIYNKNDNNIDNNTVLNKEYLIYCFDHNMCNSIASGLNIGNNIVNDNGLVTNKYYYPVYKHIKKNINYNTLNIKHIQQLYNIFSSNKFRNTLLIVKNTTDTKIIDYVPAIIKNNNLVNITDTDIGKYITDKTNLSNVIIYKIIQHTINIPVNNKQLVFIDEIKAPNKYYANMNNIYKSILQKKGFNTLSKDILDLRYNPSSYVIYFPKLAECMKLKNSIFVINAVNFATLLFAPIIDISYNFIKNAEYIILWQEVLNEDLSITGYHNDINKRFISDFFKLSKLNIVSNIVSLNTLYKIGVYHNIYFSLGGYSEICNIIPLNSSNQLVKLDKSIDVFIYGSFNREFRYRNNFISRLKHKSSFLNIFVGDNYWDTELDQYLSNTKIVVHVPSHENCNHMPWAKINYLQTKKVFFIVEENDEIYKLNLNIVPFYKKNNIDDLLNKITYFLKNPHIMKEYIDNNYKYIKIYNNLDQNIPFIMDKLI